MKKFKVGDKVTLDPNSMYAGNGESNPIEIKGEIVLVEGFGGRPYIVAWENGTKNSYLPVELLPVKQTKEKKDMTTNTWSFHSNISYDIDFDEISSHLSYQNPVAFVSRGSVEYAVLHRRMALVLENKGLEESLADFMATELHDGSVLILLEDITDRSTITDLLTLAKRMPWKDKDPAKVEVIIPKI